MAANNRAPGLAPKRPAGVAGRHLLAEHIDALARCLPNALERPFEDVEHVHQLRVAARRTEAALDAFAELFDKSAAGFGKAVRRIRRAAGDARDFDVRLADLAAHRPGPEAIAGWHWLTGLCTAGRAATQEKLHRAAAKHGPDLLAVPKVKRRGGSLARLARSRVRAAFVEFDRCAAADLTDAVALHQARLRAKDARYAVELFRSVLPTVVGDDAGVLLKAVQDELGMAHDQQAAAAWLDRQADFARHAQPERWPAWQSAVDEWQGRAAREALAARQRFERLLSDWRTLAAAAREQL